MTSLPPKPTHDFFPLRFSPPQMVTQEERRSMIETVAFMRAANRQFESGHELEDWLAAEAEVNSRIAHVRSLAGNAQ